MAKTVNLTIRISPQLRDQARAAADFLDLDLSKVVRDAFRSMIEHAESKSINQEERKQKFAAWGLETPITSKQEAEIKEHGIDTTFLSIQQRQSLQRAARSGKFDKPKPMRSLKDDILDSIRERVVQGQITQAEADRKIYRLEHPDEV